MLSAPNMTAMLMTYGEDMDQGILVNIIPLSNAKHLPFGVNIVTHNFLGSCRIYEDDFNFH